jgi:hypothetical protein
MINVVENMLDKMRIDFVSKQILVVPKDFLNQRHLPHIELEVLFKDVDILIEDLLVLAIIDAETLKESVGCREKIDQRLLFGIWEHGIKDDIAHVVEPALYQFYNWHMHAEEVHNRLFACIDYQTGHFLADLLALEYQIE